MLPTFIAAIHSKNKIYITFFSKEDGFNETRLCAPMDYGPKRQKNTIDKRDKFHAWDYESDDGPHTISMHADQIVKIELSDETFEPREFVTWVPKWQVVRDWGIYS